VKKHIIIIIIIIIIIPDPRLSFPPSSSWLPWEATWMAEVGHLDPSRGCPWNSQAP